MNEHELSYFHLEQGDFNLKLKKGPDADSIASIMSAMPQVAPMPAPVAQPALQQAAAPAPAGGDATPAPATAAGEEITSPMVGTFYRKASPDAPNFVEVGAAVKEGDTLCIIEAMKVMNEIKADKSGTITEVAVDDATPVQFGDVLFRIQ